MSKKSHKDSNALSNFYDRFTDYHQRSALFFEMIGTFALSIDTLDPDTASGLLLTADKLKSESAELRQQLRTMYRRQQD